jgi:hypothetical protein
LQVGAAMNLNSVPLVSGSGFGRQFNADPSGFGSAALAYTNDTFSEKQTGPSGHGLGTQVCEE